MSGTHSFGGSKLSRQGIADKHHARVEWLRARPKVWAGLPSDTEDVEEDASIRLAWLVREMRAANLLGTGTNDIHKRAIRKAIGVLKREQVSA